jgi:hypothetical protein
MKREQFDYSQAMAQRWFDYDPNTGILTSKISRPRVKAGQSLGSNNSRGYLSTSINNRNEKIHNLIVLWMTGIWPRRDTPTKEIHHADHNRSNNRWSNLCLVTHQQNTWELSDTKGYSYRASKRKYQARIGLNYQIIHLGYFDTPEEASKAYQRAVSERNSLRSREEPSNV